MIILKHGAPDIGSVNLARSTHLEIDTEQGTRTFSKSEYDSITRNFMKGGSVNKIWVTTKSGDEIYGHEIRFFFPEDNVIDVDASELSALLEN